MKDYKSLQNGTDIRGTAIKDYGEEVNLTKEAARDICCAFALWLSKRLKKNDLVISLGRDSRLSGEGFEDEIKDALLGLGVNVLCFGLSTTPAMFMSTKTEVTKADGAIMITASHLPYNRNGLKFFTYDGGLEKKDISDLIKLAENEAFENISLSSSGCACYFSYLDTYKEHLKSVICKETGNFDKPLLGLHVVIDAGNGSGGFYAKLLEELGADISGSQFLDADGTFPNHIPNPENKEAMDSICAAVKKYKADLGIIFDTDVDRASAVGSDGESISRNRIVALTAALLPPCTVVTDSVTSNELTEFLEKKSYVHYRYKRGYKNVIDKGIELNSKGENCLLAIETSGHAALKENYFLDDGAYLAAKIVAKASILKKEGKAIESLIEELSESKESIEVRFKIKAKNFDSYANDVLEYLNEELRKYPDFNIVNPNYEGLRVNTRDGWFLIRKSLHDAVMPINIESNIDGGCDKILRRIKDILASFSELV